MLLVSWWYSRKVAIEVPRLTFSEFRLDANDLLKLGFAFMVSGVMTMGAAYAVRAMVVQIIGLDAAGFYQAAWTLGGLYVGIILQSMGADFYPRLVAASDDHPNCNRLVNEQAQISMLLAAPGVIATITLGPAGDPYLLCGGFCCGSRCAALDLPWNCRARGHLADGFHHRRQEQAGLFHRG